MDQHPGDDLAGSRYASLVETDEEYRVQRVGRATVESFPLTDEGFDAAWDRYEELTRAGRSGGFLSALVIVGVVAAVLWFVGILSQAVLYIVTVTFDRRSTDALSTALTYVASFGTVFYALFAVAVGGYAVLWLHRRGTPPRRRRG
jgi:hypothetical protein